MKGKRTREREERWRESRREIQYVEEKEQEEREEREIKATINEEKAIKAGKEEKSKHVNVGNFCLPTETFAKCCQLVRKR